MYEVECTFQQLTVLQMNIFLHRQLCVCSPHLQIRVPQMPTPAGLNVSVSETSVTRNRNYL